MFLYEIPNAVTQYFHSTYSPNSERIVSSQCECCLGINFEVCVLCTILHTFNLKGWNFNDRIFVVYCFVGDDVYAQMLYEGTEKKFLHGTHICLLFRMPLLPITCILSAVKFDWYWAVHALSSDIHFLWRYSGYMLVQLFEGSLNGHSVLLAEIYLLICKCDFFNVLSICTSFRKDLSEKDFCLICCMHLDWCQFSVYVVMFFGACKVWLQSRYIWLICTLVISNVVILLQVILNHSTNYYLNFLCADSTAQFW